MNRKRFLETLGILPLIGCAMKSQEIDKLTSSFGKSEKMPVLFMGHGSPMNAIEDNEFVRGFIKMGEGIPRPKAVLCISAHWETRGTFVTAMEMPKTIHDFGGFPQELFDVQYPAPGSPAIAQQTAQIVSSTQVGMDHSWGLDHGAWSVVKHLYPLADVPVLQMSIDYTKPPQYHYDLAKELSALRDKGVLIIGSGNMVHNLGMVAWDKFNVDNYGFDWALEASEKMKKYINDRDHQKLINYKSQGKAFDLAIPSADHFIPLLYALALQEEKETTTIYNDKALAGSLTMTSLKIS